MLSLAAATSKLSEMTGTVLSGKTGYGYGYGYGGGAVAACE